MARTPPRDPAIWAAAPVNGTGTPLVIVLLPDPDFPLEEPVIRGGTIGVIVGDDVVVQMVEEGVVVRVVEEDEVVVTEFATHPARCAEQKA